MSTNFAIIGGDLRTIKLAQILSKDKNKIYTYGLEKAEELKNKSEITICDKLSQAIEKAEIIIAPIPFSKNKIDINTPFSNKTLTIKELIKESNEKKIIAGGVTTEVYKTVEKENQIIDIMQKEELAILNTIATAEGTIEIMMSNTKKIIHGSEVLILGFGRIAKVLSTKLVGLSVKVTCAARKKEDMAWIKAFNYNSININELNSNLKKYDIIINTVPHLIINKEKIEYIKKDCLLIDLASNPGGIDRIAAKEKELHLIWALAIPGKVAPITSAEFIKEIIDNIIKEEKQKKEG